MSKVQNNLKKLACSAGALCLVASVSSAGAFSWPWSKKPDKKAPVAEVKKESVEVIEAHKVYVDASNAAQNAYREYQEAAAEYKKAHMDTSKTYEDLQKATAVWSETVAERDKAYDRWCVDCESKGEAYDAWRLSSQKEQEARVNKENIYVEWDKKRVTEQKNYEKREEAYKRYAAALIKQKDAHITWSRMCSEKEQIN